jgi:chemotaxis-related protein WspB
MLLLLFRAGPNVYAMDSRRVIEVIPRVEPRALPHSPAFLLGLLSYRGRVVPVVDFSVLTGAGTSAKVLSTRIIVTEFTGCEGAVHGIGLVAEHVSEVVDAERCPVIGPSTNLEETPYLGEVRQYANGLIQRVLVDKLLPNALQRTLYGGDVAEGAG